MVGLDKKEALLLQLRAMNDEAAAGMHAADASGAAAPAFVNAYAGVVLQLKDVRAGVLRLACLLRCSHAPACPPAVVPARACLPACCCVRADLHKTLIAARPAVPPCAACR